MIDGARPAAIDSLLVGLMSGTSMDGIDACLVRLRPAARPQMTLLGWAISPYSDELRGRLARAILGEVTPAELACLHAELGYRFAEEVTRLLAHLDTAPDQVAAIGCHGHTIYHDPERREGHSPCSWQIGEAAIIAAETGITTVSNFRPTDVALQGQGAPLMAWVDHYLFDRQGRCLAFQNLGGIANVTVLGGDGDPAQVLAFDSGPGNMIIDRMAELASQGRLHYDHNGEMAAAGRPHEGLLARLLSDPYFERQPPKSTGREHFGHSCADRLWFDAQGLGLSDEDALATATEFTVRSIADAFQRFILPHYPVREVIVSGGGVHNSVLLKRLQGRMAPVAVTLSDHVGIPADIKEAVGFALLAHATITGQSNNLPMATGATRPAVLGQITPGQNYRRVRLAPPHLPIVADLSSTEQRHPLTADLDQLGVSDILETMNREDQRVMDAVADTLPAVEKAVYLVQQALRQGGRLFYVGAGTSGRLGMLDAVECPPTFRSEPRQFQAILAGGSKAMVAAVEGAEDQREDGVRAIKEHEVHERDVVMGITASGTTPFVRAALSAAKQKGAATILLSCNALQQADPDVDLVLVAAVGPEILAGSTRLKSGTATKLILNMISTAVMVRLGKVFSNLMVDLHASNAKLEQRSLRIIETLTALDADAARRLLDQARGKVKTALVMWKCQVDQERADALLRQHDGFLRPLWDDG